MSGSPSNAPLRTQEEVALDALPKALESNERLRKALSAIATNRLKSSTNHSPAYNAGVKAGLAIAAAMARTALGEQS